MEVSITWKGLDVTADVYVEKATRTTPGCAEVEEIALHVGSVELSELAEHLHGDESLRAAILKEVGYTE